MIDVIRRTDSIISCDVFKYYIIEVDQFGMFLNEIILKHKPIQLTTSNRQPRLGTVKHLFTFRMVEIFLILELDLQTSFSAI